MSPSVFQQAVESRRALAVCLFVTVAAFQFGYDSSYYSGILTMQPFLKIFGHLDPVKGVYVLSAERQSLTTSIINAGEFVGAISSFVIGERLGPRSGLFVSSAAVIIGTLIQVLAPNVGALIAGRLILGYAVGLISCLVPVYIADCAPARFRGALVSMYQYCLGLGLLLGVIVDYCTKDRTDTASFKIPIAVQFVFPVVLVPGLLLFVPESPRWLVQTNNIDKAKRSIMRLTGKSAERAEEDVTQLRLLQPMSNESSWRGIFTWGPEGRKAYLGCALQALQQATGINFITGYGIVFFFQIGIDNPFLIQMGLYLVAMPAVWMSQYAIEKFGRRPILIISGLLTFAVLIIMGGAGLTKHKSTPLEQTIVAMVYIFLVVFNLGWGPTVWVVTSEIATGPNRSKLFALSTGSNWFFNWVVSFSFPYLFNADAAGMGAKIGFLYGALTLCAVVWVYFLLPETSGLSLEQIQMAFEAGASPRSFKESALILAASAEEELRDLPNDKEVAINYVETVS
ncbi:general substrate transporter, partial [Aureobasidium melanogenum]